VVATVVIFCWGMVLTFDFCILIEDVPY
jgi:hypothetical protein